MKLSHIVAWFPIFLMAALAILAYWLADVLQRSHERPATIDHEPDYIIYQFQVKKFDETGFLSHILHGQTITHYADDLTATIEQPIILFRPEEQKPTYRFSAQLGHMDENLREAVLTDDVRIIRQSSAGLNATLYTEKIRYNDKTGIAETTDPVTVVSGNNRFYGQKLTVYTREDRLILQDKVTATFSPNSMKST